MSSGDESWTIASAKARFSELVEQAQNEGPQTVTKHGKDAVVVVSADEWKRKTQRVGNLADFFAASPLRNSGLKIPPRTRRARRVDL